MSRPRCIFDRAGSATATRRPVALQAATCPGGSRARPSFCHQRPSTDRTMRHPVDQGSCGTWVDDV